VIEQGDGIAEVGARGVRRGPTLESQVPLVLVDDPLDGTRQFRTQAQ
jgi:hypothetical protein